MKKIRAKIIISFILTMAMIVGILPAGILSVGASETEQYNTFADPDFISLTEEPPDDYLSDTNTSETSEENEILEDETILEDEQEEEPPIELYIYENAITYGDFEYIIEEPTIMSFSATPGINNNQGIINRIYRCGSRC